MSAAGLGIVADSFGEYSITASKSLAWHRADVLTYGAVRATNQPGWSVWVIPMMRLELNAKSVVAMMCCTLPSPWRKYPPGTQSCALGNPRYLMLRSPPTTVGA